MLFDGKQFAREIEEQVGAHVTSLVRAPKVVSILVGDDPASELYTRLKKQAAERVGVDFAVKKYTTEKVKNLEAEIAELGAREDVTGVMVQLPLPEPLRGFSSKYIKMIPLTKDVDGLRWEESKIMPATVRAILSVLERIAKDSRREILDSRFVVVGARGSVGRPLAHYLRERRIEVAEVEWDTPDPAKITRGGDVVISCTGKAGIVTGGMVKNGVVALDVGSPKGDMTQEVYEKASVAVPVPGGVGPVTIACLMANALDLF